MTQKIYLAVFCGVQGPVRNRVRIGRRRVVIRRILHDCFFIKFCLEKKKVFLCFFEGKTWRKSKGACLDEAENKGLKNDASIDECESNILL